MSTRLYNVVETKADLYARIPSDGECQLLMSITTIGDIQYCLWQYDASSAATDNFEGGVIKPDLQTGNGRWLFRGYHGVPSGSLLMWVTNTPPAGYLICDGSAVSRSTYVMLFSVIGTVYGTGDGSTTFNLPDLRQRFPLGKAASGTGSTLGDTGGIIDHTHPIDPPNTTTSGPSATITGLSLLGVAGGATDTHTHDVNIASFNSGGANPPFCVINFIIKT